MFEDPFLVPARWLIIDSLYSALNFTYYHFIRAFHLYKRECFVLPETNKISMEIMAAQLSFTFGSIPAFQCHRGALKRRNGTVQAGGIRYPTSS